VTNTPLKNIRFIILKTFHTISTETNDDGAIKARQDHTPTAQNILISLEDFRFIILAINGMFQKGKIIAAIRAILLNIVTTRSLYVKTFKV
jgi:hypothetical protein